MTPADVRDIIDEAYESIKMQMLDFMFWQTIAKHRKPKLLEWPECTKLLQIIKRLQKDTHNCNDFICGLNNKCTKIVPDKKC